MKMKHLAIVSLMVLSMLFFMGCADDDDDAATVIPPQYTFAAVGGNGGLNGGAGGDGGEVDIHQYYGSLGKLEILASGSADASFTPRTIVANLGPRPLAITANTTIPVLDPATPGDEALAAAAVAYLVTANDNVYIWRSGVGDVWATQLDADGDPLEPVTGISVAEGAVLTFELNNNGGREAAIDLDYDFDNNGTVTTADVDAAVDAATPRGDLDLEVANYLGNSAIDTSATADGQDGGDVDINCGLSFFNSGAINTAGADGTTIDAGDGGHVDIWADFNVENTGNFTTTGGSTAVATFDGGDGGYIDLASDGYVYNSGDLDASGGDGVDLGGDGNSVYFNVDYLGDLRNSGNINTSGGNATNGDAGDGDYVDFYVYGGSFYHNADITTTGGTTTEAASDGGDGGDIYAYVDYEGWEGYTAAGDVLFSGNVDTSGGAAVADATGTGDGGDAGDFEIYTDYDDYPLGQRVALLGYTGSAEISGGSGSTGGDGGDFDMHCDYSYKAGLYGSGCNLTNELGIISRGGSTAGTQITPADGGDGGYVEFWTAYDYAMFDSSLDNLVNKGDIDTTGGDSTDSTTDSNGVGGDVYFFGYNGVTNTGNITTAGGNDLLADGGTDGYGNYADDIDIYSEAGTVSNSGALDCSGGDGDFRGGDADEIELFGIKVVNSGSMTTNGGNATATLADSEGGYADVIVLHSFSGKDAANTGTASYTGGTGETPGEDGAFVVDSEIQAAM